MPAKKTAAAPTARRVKKAAPAPEPERTYTSRAGMTVHAKGDRLAVFRAAAEAKGYRVIKRKIRTTGQLIAVAKKGAHEITVCWTPTGAWDYDGTWENTRNGHKLRNLALAIARLQG